VLETNPEILYHYCSLDTFTKIMQSHSFLMSDIRLSNDSMEVIYIYHKLIDALTGATTHLPQFIRALYQATDAKGDDSNSTINAAVAAAAASAVTGVGLTSASLILAPSITLPAILAMTMYHYLQNKKKPKDGGNMQPAKANEKTIEDEQADIMQLQQAANEYINHDCFTSWGFCLSEVGDSLGQWRGYGNNGMGISIGFDADYLDQLNDIKLPLNQPYFLGMKKVQYFDDCIELQNLLKLEHSSNQQGIDSTAQYVKDFLFGISSLAPLVKNPSFSEEKEWRAFLVAGERGNPWYTDSDIVKQDQLNGIRFGSKGFMVKNNRLVSHVPVLFDNNAEAIKQIIIGPKAGVRIEDVKRFLVQYGYLDDFSDDSIEIIRSKSTYQ